MIGWRQMAGTSKKDDLFFTGVLPEYGVGARPIGQPVRGSEGAYSGQDLAEATTEVLRRNLDKEALSRLRETLLSRSAKPEKKKHK
jgi:hypothetical protein